MQACTAAGLLVVAHEQGEVRVYQFSQCRQDVTCVELDGHKPQDLQREQPPGFQCILQCSQHVGAVVAMDVSTKLKLVALADDQGTISMLDLTAVRCSARHSHSVHCSFSMCRPSGIQCTPYRS